MEKRKGQGNPTDTFFDSLSDQVAPLARALRIVIREAVPEVSESIKWNMPVYELNKVKICAIRPARAYVALQFYGSGTRLDDPDGLLEGTGKKMRHAKIRSKHDIRKRLFNSWIRQITQEA